MSYSRVLRWLPVLGWLAIVPEQAIAQASDPAQAPTANPNPEMSQVTSVSQLSDVRPTDWAFPALQSLVERYGCISGYPDGLRPTGGHRTYRGNRAISRFEFAAAVNACMGKVTELVMANEGTSQADLDVIKRLQTEFATELAALRSRTDGIETSAKRLVSQSFSTTTKLYGQAVIAVQGSNRTDVDFFPRDGVTEREAKAETTLAYNLQLTLATSFTGKDLLLTGLQTGNGAVTAPSLFTTMGRLAYESTANSQLVVSDLSYRFPLSPNFGVLVGPIGVNPENTFRGINPLEGYGEGAISLLGQRNPIISLGNTNAGVGFDWQISDRASLQGVYSAALADLPTEGAFGDRWTAGLQVSLAPTDQVNVGLNYLFSRSADGVINPGIGDGQILAPFAPAVPFRTHALGATAAWRVNPKWTLGTWGGWTSSTSEDLDGSVQTTNWMVFSTFPDLLAPGNLGGILFGQPPKITRSTLPIGNNFPNFSTGGTAGGQPDTSLHLEAFYRAQVNPRISVTPGLLVIFNPNHNKANGTIVQGVVRATYQF